MSTADAFDPTGFNMTVMMPDAVARANAALDGIGTLSGLLNCMLENADFEDDAPEVESRTTRGILNAIAVCAAFASDHINASSMSAYYSLALEADDAGFDQIKALTQQAKELQLTKRSKRRLEIVEGQS